MTFAQHLALASTAAAALVLGLGARPVAAEDKPAEKVVHTVLDDLQAAFQGESNANARYEAFAKKADEEGYAQVARLFRAAARAEKIHAASHGQVIRSLGAEPKAEIANASYLALAFDSP